MCFSSVVFAEETVPFVPVPLDKNSGYDITPYAEPYESAEDYFGQGWRLYSTSKTQTIKIDKNATEIAVETLLSLASGSLYGGWVSVAVVDAYMRNVLLL